MLQLEAFKPLCLVHTGTGFWARVRNSRPRTTVRVLTGFLDQVKLRCIQVLRAENRRPKWRLLIMKSYS